MGEGGAVRGVGFYGGCASAGRRLGYVSGLRKRHLATLSGQAPIVAPRLFRTSRGLFADARASLAALNISRLLALLAPLVKR